MRTPTRTLIAALTLGTAILAAPAAAQTNEDNFWFEAQFYWPSVDTTIQVNSVANNTIGTEIDFEDDLDFGDGGGLPSFTAGARLGRSWRIVGEFYSLGRSSDATLARNIVFDGVTYPVNATVSSEFDSSVYRFTVGYSFVRNEAVEVGASLGLHATDFTVSIEGQGSVGGGAPATLQSRRREALAPLPTIGFYLNYEVAPNLHLGGNLDFLSLKVGDYDGKLVNAQASLQYRFTRNFGVGIMYRYVDYGLGIEKDTYVAEIDYRFSGPAVFLQAGF